MDKSRIGRRVKAFRKLKGFTQVGFARELNISINSLGALERGTREVSDELIELIAETLGINKAELVGMEEE
ncbi:helix-turn-helix domain-containing protein [Ornithinibacillus californiensis]|uniref:helix-turn-helix domain-containing protein n=1 Tax=Ornithinibacillus californiensis TaxID=161536 RepID=UPI00064DA84D|nr:helix-turn-helix transcriptional regulator [Ornithinibacillus californiensis]